MTDILIILEKQKEAIKSLREGANNLYEKDDPNHRVLSILLDTCEVNIIEYREAIIGFREDNKRIMESNREQETS